MGHDRENPLSTSTMAYLSKNCYYVTRQFWVGCVITVAVGRLVFKLTPCAIMRELA